MMFKATLIGDYLHHWADKVPDREALVHQNRRLTYRDYRTQVIACAKALLTSGVKSGDRVAVLSGPRPEVMIIYLAASEIGAIFVGLNDKGKLAEYQYVFGDAQPTTLFSVLTHGDREYRHDIEELTKSFHYLKKVVLLDKAGRAEDVTFDQFLDSGRNLPDANLEACRKVVDPAWPAIIVYTSGSTGKPKGALVTHRSVLAGMGAQAHRFESVQPFRVLFPGVPIHHLGSIGNVGTSALIRGGTIVFMDHFSPTRGLALVAEEKITLWAQVPTMFLMQLSLPDYAKYDLSSVQAIFFAGSAMPREAVISLAKLNGVDLVTGYGLTETSGPATLSERGATIEELSDTIGKAVACAELKLVDDQGLSVESGMTGELLIRGDLIFAGYLNRPEATQEAIDYDGWFRTGDLAVQDGTGNIHIVGRKQEAFKSGGANVYPLEIEEVLLSDQRVAMVCVVSVPDPTYQEVGYAYVVPQSGQLLTEEEIKAYCEERLAKYKVPRRFVLRETLPTIGIGKIDRAALKREANLATSTKAST